MERLNIKHKKPIEALLHEHPPVTCELAFASLFAWREPRNMSTIQIDNSFALVTQKEKGLTMFGPPIGELTLVDALHAVEEKTDMRVVACERIPESLMESVKTSEVEFFEDRNNFDYVYRREDLAELKGRKYHNKRNLIAQCLAEHDCTYETISPSLIPEIKDMQERWCAQRNCGKKPGLCHEYQAIMALLDNYNDLDVRGGAIRIDGKIQAYTLGSMLNEKTAAIHFEKAMTEYKGLYQLINQWFCQSELSNCEFINREQDVGVEGIRKAKESYFPDHMIKKFVALHNISRDEYEMFKTKEAHCE